LLAGLGAGAARGKATRCAARVGIYVESHSPCSRLVSPILHTFPFCPTHTGTSYAHADSTGTQLKTLQAVFKRLQNGEIGRVEGDWKYQLGSGGNKIITAKEWKERLPKSFLWIDFCCIPQMSIPLTEELLGVGSNESGENDDGSRGDRRRSSSGWKRNGGRRGGGGSLLLVKAAVLKEMETGAIPRRRAKSVQSVIEPRKRTRLSIIGGSFVTSFRDLRRESTEKILDNDGKMPEDGLRDDGGETEGGDDHSVTAADGDADEDATTDHRHVSSDTEGWKKINKIMLGRAVESIPAYVERSSLIIALVPPCKHADRKDEICDQSSWRGRGWCRVEYLGAALVRSDVSVMLVNDAFATPAFVFPLDGLQLLPGHGTYTCCSRKFEGYPTLRACCIHHSRPPYPLSSPVSTRCLPHTR